MRLNQEYLGSLFCEVLQGELTAGMPNTIRAVYTVGKYGIDDGGNIRFARQGVTDWEAVQTADERESGYSTVSASGEASVKILPVSDGIRPYENAVTVHVSDGCLKEGDRVELLLGDTSAGSPGIITQTMAERNHRIIAMVDPFGSNRYEEIHPACFLHVKSGVCGEVGLVAPSKVGVNEPFEMRIRILDEHGNRCEEFTGEVEIETPAGFWCESRRICMEREDRGVKLVTCRIEKEGSYLAHAHIPAYDLHSAGNVVKAENKMAYHLFWGDMHGQNCEAGGLGSMEDSMEFAREVGALDFTGWQGNDFEVSDENWEHVGQAIRKNHCDGRFVVFPGYEWSGNTCAGGDHNIYYLNDGEKLYHSSRWLYKEPGRYEGRGREDDGEDCYPVSELWERFRGRTDVMAIPHVGGRHADFSFYNPELTPVIEVHSHHGIFDWFLEEAVSRKMKVGFIASSDDHTSRLGLSYPVGTDSGSFGATFDVKSGLTAVYAKELTREGIWEALKERRCYGTTSSRIIAEFNVNGVVMGSEITAGNEVTAEFGIRANAPVDRVELYRNLDRIHTFTPDSVKLDDKAGNTGMKDTGMENALEEMICKADGKKKIKIAWTGVKTYYRNKSVRWDGSILVRNGRIAGAENFAIDNCREGIQSVGNQTLHFKSKTSGDEDGVIMDVIPVSGKQCEIIFASMQKTVTVPLEMITDVPYEHYIGEVGRKVTFSLERTQEKPEDGVYSFTGEFKDCGMEAGLNLYYIKAYLKDGNRAWVSPVFVNSGEQG